MAARGGVLSGSGDRRRSPPSTAGTTGSVSSRPTKLALRGRCCGARGASFEIGGVGLDREATAAETKTSLVSFSMADLAATESRLGSRNIQSQHCVSKSSFKASRLHQTPLEYPMEEGR